jgi:hypothetical protein
MTLIEWTINPKIAKTLGSGVPQASPARIPSFMVGQTDTSVIAGKLPRLRLVRIGATLPPHW